MRGISFPVAILLCGLLLTNSAVLSEEEASPAETGPEPSGKEVSQELRDSVKKGMDYLVKAQDPKTGTFGSMHKVATTSLAGMALLSGGHLPGRGKYCENLEKAIRFIVEKAAQPSGYIQFENTNMYGHGFATLFLAEVYGTVPPYKSKLQQDVRKTLKKAVALLEKCQNAEGGWWYNPIKNSGGGGADISVTVCQTNALRAARNCGIAVDKRVIGKALKCVKRAANPDGGFSYRVYVAGRSGGSAFERSAAAVCILQALGAHDSPESKKGLDYLLREGKITSPTTKAWRKFYYYGVYYSTQAMFMAGKKYWDQWWPGMRDQLLFLQKPSGCFGLNEKGGGGGEYTTAVALIILQIPYRYLPVYQEGIRNAPGASE